MTDQDALLQLQHQIYRTSQKHSPPLEHVMGWLLDPRNLEAAWRRIRGNDGAKTPGPDGQTAKQVEPKKEVWLKQLVQDLYRGKFQPQPPRIIKIPKPDSRGAVRELGILNLRDRVAHAAMKQVLEPIWEPPRAFGSRSPRRSGPTA